MPTPFFALPLVLAPAVLAAGPQDSAQARLHPRDAVIYIELPDMRALLDAYGSAPTARMMRDEEVVAAMTELMATAKVDLSSVLDRMASESGMPAEMLHAPIRTLNGYLGKAAGASLSASLAESVPGEFAETLGRVLGATRELAALEDALYLYAVDHDGAFPTTLGELELGGVDSTDPWGRPYAYSVGADGSFRLSSLGSDGVGGGEGGNADLTALTDVEPLIGHEFAQRVGVTFAVRFHDAADAKQVMQLLRDLAAKTPLEEADGSRPAQAADADLVWFDEGWGKRPNGDPYLWMMRTGDVLSVGAGSSDPKGLLERIAGHRATVLDSAGYVDLTARFGDRSGATVSRAFLNFSELLTALQTMDPVAGSNLAFLAPYAKSTWRTGLEVGPEETRFLTESYSTTGGEDNPLAQCVAHAPVPDGLWKFVPTDAVAAYASSIDAGLLYETMFDVLRADLDDDAVTKLNKLEAEYGFEVAALFDSLGGGVAAYMLPITGLMALPGIAIVAELEDEEAFRTNLEGMLALLEAQSGGEFSIKTRPYRDQPLWYFSFKSGGPPIPISPSLTIVDGHLLLTLTSTRAKKEIKRVLASLEPDAEPLELHAVRGLAPEDATMIGYMDWTELFDGVYNGAKGALALMGGNLELPVDVSLLPEADLFTRFYEPSTYWTQIQGDVIYGRVESSFGPETVLGLAGLVGGGVATFKAGQSRPMPEAPVSDDGLEAAPAAKSPTALQQTTRDRMRFLATRLAVYRLEAGRYPASLNELLEATENYPRGFLDGAELPADAWSNGFAYSVANDGTSYRLWSLGPDGADQSGEGDDLVN